jgi:hypothetical protein
MPSFEATDKQTTPFKPIKTGKRLIIASCLLTMTAVCEYIQCQGHLSNMDNERRALGKRFDRKRRHGDRPEQISYGNQGVSTKTIDG